MKKVISILIVMSMALSLCACGSGRSSSKRWSSLSPVEKSNAKWAYDVQQGLKGK